MSLIPVRKIGMSHRSVTGKRTSNKNQSVLQFESTLEKDFLTLLEYDDTVEEYGVQPLRIYYKNNGLSSRYTPDVLVKYQTGLHLKPAIYEVKYAAELEAKKEEYAARFKAAENYAAENGYIFKVITEREIRTDYLWNIKFLSPYRDNHLSDQHVQMILNQFDAEDGLSPKDILEDYDRHTSGIILNTLWEMLAAKQLYCEMHQKITMSTIIWKKQD